MKKAISFLLVSLFMFSVLSLVASARPKYAYDESKKKQHSVCGDAMTMTITPAEKENDYESKIVNKLGR